MKKAPMAAATAELVGIITDAGAEIARCHARLEIDHAWRRSGGALKRFGVPMAERADFPDGIACRNETIKALEARIDKLKAVVREQALEYLALDQQHAELETEMEALQAALAECRLNLKMARGVADA